MKFTIFEFALLDVEAPALPAYEVVDDGDGRWAVWCTFCGPWHLHGPAEDHSEAHCQNVASPYWRSGYDLEIAGPSIRRTVADCMLIS